MTNSCLKEGDLLIHKDHGKVIFKSYFKEDTCTNWRSCIWVSYYYKPIIELFPTFACRIEDIKKVNNDD